MKIKSKILLAACSFLFSTFCCLKAQNLVPNPSFEDTIGCPQGPDEIYEATAWTSFANSPDYFYGTCPMSVPYNWGGYQQAASGIGYAAIATFQTNGPNLREYVGCQLLSPLNIGTKYFVSFKSCLSLGATADANCAANNIGAMFSTISYDVFQPAPITNNPQVYSNIINSDSVNWTTIFGSFTADSSYVFIAIGNFFDDSNTDTIKYYNTFSDASYYFIDDICVSTDSLFALNYSYVGIKTVEKHNYVVFYPNPSDKNLTIKNITKEKIEYRLVSTYGETIISGKVLNGQNIIIETEDIAGGIYLLRINDVSSYKILIQH